MKTPHTPGVYISEQNAFPGSVVEVATAVPAFIGYTEKADSQGQSLRNVPCRISSFTEFQVYFGGAPLNHFRVTAIGKPANPPAQPSEVRAFSAGGREYQVWIAQKREQQFLLYYSMCLFFDNGGGLCYVVSVGGYDSAIEAGDEKTGLLGGLNVLLQEQEPAIVAIPDAVHLPDEPSCIKVQQAMVQHCGEKTRSRVAILDIYDGYKDRRDPAGDCVATFREDLEGNHLSYAAAYYPWLNANLGERIGASYANVAANDLISVLTAEAKAGPEIVREIAQPTKAYTPEQLNRALTSASPAFSQIMKAAGDLLNVLPPSGAIAGVYSAVDVARGVWKAPANVSLNSVVSPAVSISDKDQEDLNVDVPQGKSVNAIRSFAGLGTLVWGARTLDGNSQDFRYISVRRTAIMLEQSIRLAVEAYVFSDNVSITWNAIKSTIRNFLSGVWKQGGLAGATPDDAFVVFCGLGETMTQQDIADGILRVRVLTAITRPAEFVEIALQVQMRES
ncbi:MAG: phage tail sheath family protein [Acidobacteriota bacterium]|nr:phage tail sheath family protein [Acidobacteriota bacterium]